MRAPVSWTRRLLVGILVTIVLLGQRDPSVSAWRTQASSSPSPGSPAFLSSAAEATASGQEGWSGRYTVPLSFEPNRGQTDPQVKFLSRGRGYTLFLTATEAVVSLRRYGEPGARTAYSETTARPSGATVEPRRSAARKWQSATVRMQLVGANATAHITGESELPGEVNYVRGRDPQASIAGIPTYARVRYEDVYPGVDLVYYDNGRQLEYDFVVAAGADPESIRLRFTGAERLAISDAGELVVHTAVGELRQPPPVIHQLVDGIRRVIAGGYVLAGDRDVSFRLGGYDRSRPLTIDPVLAYSTFFGGGTDEIGWDIAVDAGGNAYVVGARPSVRFPEWPDYDAFVAKFSAGGALLWVTDVGDICDDEGRGLAVDAMGNAYLTGQLGNCYPFPELQAGAFVAKLNPSGGASYVFPFSDPYSGSDLGQAVAVDSAGNTYITGITSSATFPTTPGAFQQQFAGGIGDGFVVKADAAGTTLLYATYLGGTAYESFNDIAVDSGGRAYVTGSTDSRDFPITPNALQPDHPGWHPGNRSGFVSKLNASGSALVYSTFLGGSDDDIAQGIAVDAGGNAYVTGVVESIDFPTTPGAFQPVPPGDRFCYYTFCTDAFVTKINASGTALVYSTYLGGVIFDEGSGIAVDAAGNAYVTGNTWSADFPTLAAFQPNPAGVGDSDAFVTKLNATGTALVYSSYLGGTAASEDGLEGEDTGIRIVADSSGNAYVTGLTRSPDFPVINAHQPTFGAGSCGYSLYRCSDAFVTKIGSSCTFSISPVSQTTGAAGGPGSVSVAASSTTCPWTATSGAAWITITGGATGTGNGTVTYSVAANTGTTSRTGALTIAGQTFTVTQAAPSTLTVAVTAPNGGEKVFTGTPYAIQWTAAGATAFDVAVSADGGATYSAIPGCTGLAGSARSCLWTTPGPATANARIRVTARDAGGSLADTSNAAFSVVSGTASLTVSFPNNAVNVGIGSTQVVKWTHNLGAQSFVRIELSRDGGATFPETLAASHRNTAGSSGTFNWLVTGPATAGAQARIRVSWTSGPTADVSNASFTIAPAFITLAAPATGSSWGFDTTQKQAWTTNLGALDRVNVQLSTTGSAGAFATMNGGANIVASLKQAKVLVPGTATTTARVKVVWANPPAGFSAAGLNPGNFRIEAPFITVTAPASGEVWPIGSAKTIKWANNLGAVETVEVRLSRDGGASYPITIVGSTPSDGKHPVTVSATWGSQNTTRVKITWLKTPAVTGTSSNFVVQP